MLLHSENDLLEIWNCRLLPETHIIEVRRLDDLPNADELAGAVYTSIRTYSRASGNPQYLLIEKHIQRLLDSLTIENYSFLLDELFLRQSIAEVVKKSDFADELRIKIVLAPKRQGEFLIITEPLKVPSQDAYTKGVSVLTTPFVRNNPKAKVFEFAEVQDQIRKQFHEDVEEVIMLSPNGEMLEGLSSNFFAIMDGNIYTAGRGVLRGVTRQIVINVAKKAGLPIIFHRVKLNQANAFEECFITSTSRGILPVISIDHKRIGPGSPGPITKHLRLLFEKEILKLIKPL